MFENKIYENIYYSRFAASWVRAGGGKFNWRFKDWLKQLVINGKYIPEEIVNEIYNYAENGKLELETNAENFIRKGL